MLGADVVRCCLHTFRRREVYGPVRAVIAVYGHEVAVTRNRYLTDRASVSKMQSFGY